MKPYCPRIIALIVVFLGCNSHLLADDRAAPSMQPGPALAKLKSGNARFIAAAASSSKPTRARRAETAKSQHPFAIIVGCSDSRTPPEIVFDQNIGDLFVLRTAGEVVDSYELGSVAYAVEHLGALASSVRVVEAYYDLDSGKVEWLNP